MCRTVLVILVIYISRSNCAIYHLKDSEYSRMPPLFRVDPYNECLQIDGIYCVGTLDLIAEHDNELMTLIQEYSAVTLKRYNHSYVNRGTCITKRECQKHLKNKDLDKREDLIAVFSACENETIYEKYGLQATVSMVTSCDRKEDMAKTQISTGDWFTAAVVAIISFLNFVGTTYDVMLRRSSKQTSSVTGNQYLLCFSVIKNWNWLVTPMMNNSIVERLSGLYSVKAITSIAVILGHVILIYLTNTDNPHDMEKSYENLMYNLIFNGLPIVIVFFVIAGFLLVINLKIKFVNEKITVAKLPLLLAYRWIRITPVYGLVIAFTATWLRHLGSGPLWYTAVTGNVVAQCREHWWRHLLFFNNYNSEDKMCLLQSWHMAADYQLYVLGTIVYVLTQNGGRKVALALMMLVGIVAPALHTWWNDYEGQVFISPEVYRTQNFIDFFTVHIRGHNNVASFTVGMIAGFVSYDWYKKGIDISKHKLVNVLVWIWLPGMVAFLLFGRIFYLDGGRVALGWRVLYAATYRIVFSSSVVICIMHMMFRWDDNMRSMWEWRGWLVPGRLSFCVYMIHMNVVHILAGIRTQLTHFTFFNMLVTWLGVSAISYMMAFPLHLMVEAPINQLINLITGKVAKGKTDNKLK